MTRKKDNAKSPHARLCKICNHVQKEEIEKRYLNWEDVRLLSKEFGMSADAIWNHGVVTGLNDKRASNKTAFLNRFMEKSIQNQKVNASDGLAACKLDAQIKGELVEKTEISNKFGIDADLLKELKGLGLNELKQLIELLAKKGGDDKEGSGS